MSIEPNPATPGEPITVTLLGDALKNRVELLLYVDGAPSILLADDSQQPANSPTTVNGYDMTPNAEPFDLTLPASLDAGNYTACLWQQDEVANGKVCGELVVG